MENASKALLMAGGMILALLTISVLVFAFNRMSATQRVNNSDTAEQTTIEFNNQFSTYNNDRVRGSELYSCLNKAMDYNRSYTTVSEDGYNWRDSEYKPITIKIEFDNTGDKAVNQLHWNDDKLNPNDHIFHETKYWLNNTTTNLADLIGNTYDTTDNKRGESKKGTIQWLEDTYKYFGGQRTLNKLASELNTIFAGPRFIGTGPSGELTNKEIYEDIKKAQDFENIIVQDPKNLADSTKINPKISAFSNYNYTKNITEDLRAARSEIIKNLNIMRYGSNTDSDISTSTSRSQLYKDVCKYYEYMQFKRAIFECTKCNYDKNTGRIDELDFKFTGKFN